jgi:hypothetical protein
LLPLTISKRSDSTLHVCVLGEKVGSQLGVHHFLDL